MGIAINRRAVFSICVLLAACSFLWQNSDVFADAYVPPSDTRVVYIPPQVGTNLKAWWLASLFKDSEDFVFAASPQRPRSQEWARKTWVRIRTSAGISERVRFHDLRHTFASILIGRQASPVELAEQLGDSVQVAMQTYAGLFDRAASETKLRSILEASYPQAVGTE